MRSFPTYGCLALIFAAGCGASAPSNEASSSTGLAVVNGGLSSANLELQISGNSCWGNGAQTYLQVKNGDAAPVKLSDVTLKYWVNDTSGSPVVPHVWYGGCVTNAAGACVHPVGNVTATAVQFPACGPDAAHQANWEITITTTDTSNLDAGFTWSNLQTGLDLASFAPFSPGSASWYSGCGTGQPFHADAHYAVYVKGDLVTNNGITPPACRAPQGSQPIASYPLPPTSPVVGTLPDTQLLTVALSLPVRNLATLQAKVDAAATPGSPTYRKWLTPAELQADFFPSSTDYAALTGWAAARGLKVASSPNRMVAGLIGTVAQIEKALFVNLITAQRPDGSIFYAPDRQPSLELGVQVLGISGIDDYVPPTPAFGGGTSPVAGSFQSSDLRGAYLGAAPSQCASLTGSGQSIGIFAPAGFNTEDIAAYQANTGLSNVPALQIQVAGTPDGETPQPLKSLDELGNSETSVDIEMAMAMAPGAQVIVFEGRNIDLILNDMVNKPNVGQLSASWRMGTSATTPQLHTVLAAQGQAFFQSSGDGGTYATNVTSPQCGPVTGQTSLNMPYITIVGGTELTTAAGVWQSDTGWNGSGGGVLPSVAIPPWQVNANPGNNQVSTVSRNAPDVAMPANGLYFVASGCDGSFMPQINGSIPPAACTGNVLCNIAPGGMSAVFLGCKAGGETKGLATGKGSGTSTATPLWAGFFALVNQRNQAEGKVGFPNPAIYAIGKGASYATSFHDVRAGTANAPCDGSAANTAQVGYDLQTGWGSPQCGLMAQLSPQVTQPGQPFIGIAGNNSQSGNFPLTLCGNGLRFSPGASVTLTMSDVPGPSGTTRAPIDLGTFTVGADSTFHYFLAAATSPIPSAIGNCTIDQLFADVTIRATSSQQEVASNTFRASNFCLNTTVGGSFGGGCQ